MAAESTAQKSAVQTPTPIPRISKTIAAEIQRLALGGGQYRSENLLGLSHGTRLFVVSNRVRLAYATAKASESGGRFTPPTLEPDVVTVTCGNSAFGDTFDCAHVRVTDLKDRPVKALSYVSGTENYRNLLGARWTVREVKATYSTSALSHGFSVAYADYSGTDWTFHVTLLQAIDDLLLRVGDEQ